MKRVAIIGGGAAGFFGAITCAEAAPDAEITIFEKGPEFLQKVRISGGGRCNVTHACFEPRELTRRYPRGERELIGPYHQFHAEETVRWFESRGVKLKIEPDGRMFPVTDSSRTIIDCLMGEAHRTGVKLTANRAIEKIERGQNGFQISFRDGESATFDRVLLATGGCRAPALGALAVSLGHSLVPPVPSLFTFNIEIPWVRELAGVSVPLAEVSVPERNLRERGALLFTHWGMSGPVILRLSAWGARELHELDYRFTLNINWVPNLSENELRQEVEAQVKNQPSRTVARTPLGALPSRLWERLAPAGQTRWAELGKQRQRELIRRLRATELPVTGKSLNKDEFVTCGGVRLNEVDFKTMQSKVCPGLFLAGELLDIDGITGGFNFQAAWTTGWIAGRSIAAGLNHQAS